MKYYKMLLVMGLGLALMPVLSLSFIIPVYAAEEEKILTTDEPMVIRFSTSAISGSSQNNQILDIVRVGLTYTVYPVSNPTNQKKETVYIENGKSTTFTKLYPVAILGTDGITYKGDFTFTVFYDTVTASLKVDGVDVAIDSNVVRNASIWPEAWLDPAIIGVAHSPLPFSEVKAVVNSDPNYIKNFNERINGGITDKIILSTSQYGSNVKTETTLKMYIWFWKRLPDGTYDKSQESTKLQVIYSAADILNGAATYSGWTGTQLYRQLKAETVSSHITVIETIPTWNGKNRTEYNVQDLIRTDQTWGYAGVVGAVSPIIAGTCVESATKHCVANYYQYSRYEVQCSNYWRTSYAYGWSSTNITTATAGNTFCKTNTTKDYYRKVNSTYTTPWVMAATYSGHTRTNTGYSYQDRVPVKIWGDAYWQGDTPDASQNYLGNRLVKVFVGVPTNFISIVKGSNVIPIADSLTEGDVNARVATYATGVIDDLIFEANNSKDTMTADVYSSYFSFSEDQSFNTAISNFREGNYWGLYLYQVGHWRAVEIPINWLEIMASAKGNITLSGSSIIPPPVVDPDTEVSLTDFAYVQAMFASAKLKHPNYSISAVQNAFIELIATDTNRAAQKTKAYYDSLVLIGKAQAEVFKMISTDFGLKLNN